MRLAPPPLALYVHFPWCLRKCPYCDFNSYTLRESLAEAPYVAALLADLERQAADLAGRPLVSIFLGGGTPSLFSPASIAAVLEAARRAFPGSEAAEVTLEANPGTIERGAFSYKGPCPPQGQHSYQWTVEAQDGTGKVLARATVTKNFPPG